MKKAGLIRSQLEYIFYAAGLLSFWTLPLMGGARYEAALGAGIWGALFIPVATTLSLKKQLHSCKVQVVARDIFLFGLNSGARYFLILLLTSGGHHLLWGTCEAFEGFLLIALGPGLGAITCATWSSVVQGIVSAKVPKLKNFGWIIALAAGPLFSAASQLKSFYQSPLVYFYDHFVGYFAGPVYDSIDYRLDTLVWFRAETLCILAFAFIVCQIFSPSKVGAKRAHLITLSIIGFNLSLLLTGASNLGYRREHSFSNILPLTIESPDCKVRFSYAVEPQRARLLLQECAAHRHSIANYLELKKPAVPTVLLFGSAKEKQRFMGAGRTQIAKPWRAEIYLTNEPFPHSILGHELAHALSGELGQGPLKIAGHLGGLIPDPGRIEGLAVASSPRFDAIGETNAWAAELLARKKLPQITELFQLGFFTLSARSSYVAAGSFVQFIVHEFGATALKRWYGGQDLETITQSTYAQLEKNWHLYLQSVVRSPELQRAAELRFQQLSVFERKCPHFRDRLVKKALLAARSGSDNFSEPYETARDYGAQGFAFRAIPVTCALAQGKPQQAVASLDSMLQDATLTSEERSQTALKRGDLAWLTGDLEAAERYFQLSLNQSSHPDHLRNVKLRLWALRQSSEVRDMVHDYLLSSLIKMNEFKVSLELGKATHVANAEARALAHYLMAKNLFRAADYQAAKNETTHALSLGLPLAELTTEARKVAALASWQQCLEQENRQARIEAEAETNELFRRYLSEELSSGEQARAEIWLQLASFCTMSE